MFLRSKGSGFGNSVAILEHGIGLTVTGFAETGSGNDPNDGNIEASVVPLPAAAWLLASTLLGFIGVSRRRRFV